MLLIKSNVTNIYKMYASSKAWARIVMEMFWKQRVIYFL